MSGVETLSRDNPRPPAAATDPVLRVVNGGKIYGGVHAIEGVNFELYPGEVHAVVGENGAGKSTLCKAIAGAIKLTQGEIFVDGKPVAFDGPRDALAAGICMVYQETSLVPNMTAAQNIELGNERLLTRFRTLNIQGQQLLQSLNFHVDPATPVALLGTAKRQMVEIARAIYNKARIIIFDEPTASLTPEEIIHFFHLVRDLRARGVAIIYISHALEESLQISDRITVLRDGKLVITAKTPEDIQRVGDKLVEEALDGNVYAAKVWLDDVLGRPLQALEISSPDRGPGPLSWQLLLKAIQTALPDPADRHRVSEELDKLIHPPQLPASAQTPVGASARSILRPPG